MAKQFAVLFQPNGWDQKAFNAEQYFADNLRQGEAGPLLFVFDNFETIQQPVETYHWLDTHIRPPNKILITTRHRDFNSPWQNPLISSTTIVTAHRRDSRTPAPMPASSSV
jgi:hypothetical protein